MSLFSTIIDLNSYGIIYAVSNVTGQTSTPDFQDDICFNPVDVIPLLFDNEEVKEPKECIISWNCFTAQCKRQIDVRRSNTGT